LKYEFEERDQEVGDATRSTTISSDVIGEVANFKYLESFVQKDRDFVVDVKHKIKYGWMKWREAKGVL